MLILRGMRIHGSVWALSLAMAGGAVTPLSDGRAAADDPSDARAAVAPVPAASNTLAIDPRGGTTLPATMPAKQGGHDHAHH
jgi:hypothetical protein